MPSFDIPRIFLNRLNFCVWYLNSHAKPLFHLRYRNATIIRTITLNPILTLDSYSSYSFTSKKLADDKTIAIQMNVSTI